MSHVPARFPHGDSEAGVTPVAMDAGWHAPPIFVGTHSADMGSGR